MHRDERFMHLFLDVEVELAAGVVEFALFAQDIGLGLLGFGQLGVVDGQILLQVGDLFVPLLQFAGECDTRLPSFGLRDRGPLSFQLFVDLFVDSLACPGEILLGLPQPGLTTGKIGFL